MAFSGSSALLLVLLGFAVGAFGTLVGAGGGFILAPVLLILYPHDSAQTLSSISIAVVFFNALSGSVAYARQRRIDSVRRNPRRRDAPRLDRGRAPRQPRVPDKPSTSSWPSSWHSSRLAARSRTRSAPHSPSRPHPPDPDRRVGPSLRIRRPDAPRRAAQPGHRVRLELPRDRRRRHPRPRDEPAARLPVHIATATSHFVLAIMSGTATLTHLARAATARATGSAGRSPSRSGSSSAPNSAPASHSRQAHR